MRPSMSEDYDKPNQQLRDLYVLLSELRHASVSIGIAAHLYPHDPPANSAAGFLRLAAFL